VSRSAPAEQRKEGRREEGEAPTGGVTVSTAQGKRKGRVGRQAAAGGIDGPAGRLGQKEGEVSFPFSFFILKHFSNLNLFNSKPFKTFQTFSQNFIKFLNLTQATKNHA
jgi:hypothetical protein